MTRCIQCTRCIRFCQEIAGTGELTFIERGGHTIVWTHEGKELANEWSGCAADVCPVGALTTKEFRFRKRVWWLDKARSVCDGCEIGCNVSIEHRDRTVYRFLPRVNLAVNDFWMCDYGRFRAEELNGNDFTRPVLRTGGTSRETNWGEALDAAKTAVDAAVAKDPASVLVLGSARLATEESWLLARLFKETIGVSQLEFHPDLGPERKIKNPTVPGGWLVGKEAAPNSRGAEAAGLARAGKGSALARLLDGSYTPDLLYVADAEFTSRASDPEFVKALRRAKTLIVHGRRTNPLTEAADVLLPVASLAGKEGTFVNVLGLVQRFQLAIVPPPIVRTDLEVLLHLGKRWGVFDTKWTAKDVFTRMRDAVPGYAGLEWDAPALVGTEPPVSPVSAYDALLERRLENPAEVLALAAEAAGAAPAGGEK
jgi:NADH-quinone oxidoreductase subunit G